MKRAIRKGKVKASVTVEAAVLVAFFLFVLVVALEGEIQYYQRIEGKVECYLEEEQVNVVDRFRKQTCYKDMVKGVLEHGN